jgi:hypothetical protein
VLVRIVVFVLSLGVVLLLLGALVVVVLSNIGVGRVQQLLLLRSLVELLSAVMLLLLLWLPTTGLLRRRWRLDDVTGSMVVTAGRVGEGVADDLAGVPLRRDV